MLWLFVNIVLVLCIYKWFYSICLNAYFVICYISDIRYDNFFFLSLNVLIVKELVNLKGVLSIYIWIYLKKKNKNKGR